MVTPYFKMDNDEKIEQQKSADSELTKNTQARQNAGAASTGEVFRVGVKPPVFCKEQPDLYFIQMESQFAVAGVKADDTKYHHIVSSLEPQYLLQIADIIRNPPPEGKYEAIKRSLIVEYTDSDQRKLRKLIREIELGDLKPSQLLKRMRDLAGDKISDEALKSLWMERLPETIRSIISIVDGNSTKMAEQADKMMEMQNFSNVATIQTSSPLQVEIENLRKEVAELRMSRQDNFHRQDNSHRPRNRSAQRNKSKVRFPFCKYHYRYGEKAKKCIEPCQYKKLTPEN